MKKKIDKSQVLAAVRNTAPISSSASMLLKTTSNPNHLMSEIVKIIKLDDILTANLLRIVNSAAFALLQTVSSIDRAVSLLGEDVVVDIAVGKAFSGYLNVRLDGYDSLPGDLWRHNLRTAIASAEISKLSKVKINKDTVFTCGIVHDIGKTIISDFLKGTAKELTEAIEKGKYTDYLSAEQEMIGVDHTIVGYELAKHWGLPENLQTAIHHHHYPSEADKEMRPIVYAVHLGDIVAMMEGIGTGSDTFKYHLDQKYKEFFNLAPDDLAKIMIKVDNEFNKINESMETPQPS